jgi:hypothetical protein
MGCPCIEGEGLAVGTADFKVFADRGWVYDACVLPVDAGETA